MSTIYHIYVVNYICLIRILWGKTEFLKDCIDYTTYLRFITTHILKINTCVIFLSISYMISCLIQLHKDNFWFSQLRKYFHWRHKKYKAQKNNKHKYDVILTCTPISQRIREVEKWFRSWIFYYRSIFFLFFLLFWSFEFSALHLQ